MKFDAIKNTLFHFPLNKGAPFLWFDCYLQNFKHITHISKKTLRLHLINTTYCANTDQHNFNYCQPRTGQYPFNIHYLLYKFLMTEFAATQKESLSWVYTQVYNSSIIHHCQQQRKCFVCGFFSFFDRICKNSRKWCSFKLKVYGNE